MRFKAKLHSDQLSLFYQCLLPLSKIASSSSAESSSRWIQNSGMLAWDEDCLRISCQGNTMDTDGIKCFAEFKNDLFFEHRIESAAAQNRIVMELDLSQLKSALQSILPSTDGGKSMDASSYIVMKLAKRSNTPCLCLEAMMGVQIHHAVPCRICPASDLSLPPQLPPPQVQLELHHHSMKHMVERLAHLSNHVRIQGNSSKGELVLQVDTEGASSKTFVQGLRVPSDASSTQQTTATCKLDTQKLAICLPVKNCYVSQRLCWIENQAVVLHGSSPMGFCTFYMPVHYLDEETLDS